MVIVCLCHNIVKCLVFPLYFSFCAAMYMHMLVMCMLLHVLTLEQVVGFCVQQLPSMVCPAVQVDEVFHLGPDAFDMPSADGSEEVTITPPCAHTGPAPVQVRLISYLLREGQVCMLCRCVGSAGPRKYALQVYR